MWDALVTIGNLVFIPALMVTILDKRAYIPRKTSGMSLLGIVVVMIGLIGAGLVFSPIVVGGIGLLWLFIFLFRAVPADA